MKIVELFKKNFLKSAGSSLPVNPIDIFRTADELIVQGNELEDQGRFDQAEEVYRLALTLADDNPKIYLNLGNVLLKKELFQGAIEAYRAAIAMKPDFASAYLNIGNAKLKSGQLEDAIENYLKAIQLDANRSEFYLAAGNTYRLLNNEAAAIPHLEACLRLKPDQLPVVLSLGMAYAVNLENQKALDAFRQVLRLDDKNIDAYLFIGTVSHKIGEIEQAVASYSKVIDTPDAPAQYYFQAGFALYEMRRHELAIRGLKKALEIEKDSRFHNILGNIYLELTKYDLAIEQYISALAFDTTLTGAMCNLGTAYANSGDFEEATIYLERVLQKDPGFFMVHNSLAYCYQNTGRPDEAVQQFYRAYESNPEFDIGYSNYLFSLSQSNSVSPEKLFEEHCRFEQLFGAKTVSNYQSFKNTNDCNKVLKIGIVSSDLRQHAVSSFIAPLLPHLAERTDIQLYAYDNGRKDDDISIKLKSHFFCWKQVRMLSDEVLVKEIQQDQIDILIDLSGHSALNRLRMFSYKPAPIQMSWIGYPGTTGLRAIDYYIGDQYYLDSPELDAQFIEKLIRLPLTTCFSVLGEKTPDCNPLPALTNGYVTFASFNRIDKISKEVVQLWSKLLQAVPTARLLLGALPLAGGVKHLLTWFEANGISSDRLILHYRTDNYNYLLLHHQVDICLDPFPYSGGTTTNSALWMGVPVLTLVGKTAAGRQSYANMAQLQIEQQFSAYDKEQFVALGIAAANNLDELAMLRSTLRQRFLESRFTQPDKMTASLVAAWRYAWQRWCDHADAVAFAVIEQEQGYRIQEHNK